jgi:uncharacterized protein (TIGR02118 family)
MIKRIGMVRRKPSLTHNEFVRYWKQVHAPLAARLIPGLKRYIIYCTVQGANVDKRRPIPEIDGVAVFYFDDLKAFDYYFNTWRKSDAAKELLEDEARFVDWNQITVFTAAEEHVVVGGSSKSEGLGGVHI